MESLSAVFILALVGTAQAINCGNPPVLDPTMMSVNYTSTTEGSVAIYTCAPGTSMRAEDQAHVTCLNTSRWSLRPVCQPWVCPSAPYVTQTSKTINYGRWHTTTGSYSIGATITYTCWSGYELADTNSLVCLENKTWSTPIPKCVPKDCGTPLFILNGQVDYDANKTTLHSVAKYTCNVGYNLVKTSSSRYRFGSSNDAYTISCPSSGKWPSAPQCKPISCGTIPRVRSASRVALGSTFYTDIVEFDCDRGYTMIGDNSINCTENGWSPRPICEKIKCGKQLSVEHATAQYIGDTSFGARIVYTCHRGFYLIGPSKVFCEADGMWTSLPTCEKINCRNPPSIHFGERKWNGTVFDSEAMYTCEEGYKLIGVNPIVCNVSGRWSATPSCELPPGVAAAPPSVGMLSTENSAANQMNQSVVVGLGVAFGVVLAVVVGCLIYICLIQSGKLRRNSFGFASFKDDKVVISE